jgi:carbamoyl-phosphate synthase large subunit
VVIEMNPRVSRSSALASKATGFPIAKIAARLAVGYRLDEIDNDITKRTPASFEPAIDYVVVKWPRFAFEKFPGVDARLSTHMKSVGEVMAIGRTFGQAFAKALRSRELDEQPDLGGDLLARLAEPSADRYDVMLEALRRGHSVEDVHAVTHIDPGSCAASRNSRAIPRRRSRASSAPTAPWTPVPPSSRPRRPTTTRPGSARAPSRKSAGATGRA